MNLPRSFLGHAGRLLLFLSLALSPLRAGGETAPLQVGVVSNPPFVMVTDGVYSGYSIDLWTRIAQLTGYQSRFVSAASPNELLDGLRKGTFDVGVSDLSITSE